MTNDLIANDVNVPGFPLPATRSWAYYRSRLDKKFRLVTKDQRVLPDFIIVGAQKSGTTSLYNYLKRHPHVLGSRRTEVHFFDNSYAQGLSYYRSYFPLRSHCRLLSLFRRGPIFTGESTPDYMLYPFSITRIAQSLPRVKIIVLLRNPVERAFSHYVHNVRLAGRREPLSFMAAIQAEEIRTADPRWQISAGAHQRSMVLNTYSYLLRGIYVRPIRQLMDAFVPDQVLIIQSERFFRDTAAVYAQVLDFLNLPAFQLARYEKVFHRQSPGYPNAHRQVPPMTIAEQQYLQTYFAPHNEALYEILGKRFDWPV